MERNHERVELDRSLANGRHVDRLAEAHWNREAWQLVLEELATALGQELLSPRTQDSLEEPCFEQLDVIDRDVDVEEIRDGVDRDRSEAPEVADGGLMIVFLFD